ncbi:MAG TPA: AAA family ATPase [Magnetospirillaceae bacterium]
MEKERAHLQELAMAWHHANRVAPFSMRDIRASLAAIDAHLIPDSAKADCRKNPKVSTPGRRPIGANLKVIASIGNSDHGEGRQLAQHYRKLIEPIALRGGSTNLDVLRVVLLREFPWMWDLVEDLFDELNLRRAAGVPWLHFAPILIVGPSGVGKTRFARRLAQLVGTGFREINAAGSSDNRLLVGTARGWHAPQPALPLLVMGNSGSANPIIVVDEIDKAKSDGHNGDVRDSLLAFLEAETARIWFDECLLAECDLSQVSWILTANITNEIPAPLLSRVRVVHVDRPLAIHFDATLASIVGEFARELGLAPNELPELGGAAQSQLRVRFEKNASVRELKSSVRRAISKSAALLDPVVH